MILNTSQQYPKAEETATERFKMQIRAKMWWIYPKIVWRTFFAKLQGASPQVGSSWDSKASKLYYGFKYDLR